MSDARKPWQVVSQHGKCPLLAFIVASAPRMIIQLVRKFKLSFCDGVGFANCQSNGIVLYVEKHRPFPLGG